MTAIPHPLDTDEYSPDPAAAKRPKSVVFAKRIDKISGGELLEAIIRGVLARVPVAFFNVIGYVTDELDGGARLQENIIREGFGGNVKFHGQINRRDVIGFYRSSRLCIVPSLLESFSYTCMEALSCGIPVVGSRVGAIPDMVRDGENGFLVEPGDVGGFVDKTVAILQNPALQDKMAVSARERILSDFNYDSIIKKNIAFYESVIYSSGKTTG
jgi:glycosyltransferase involved in cell wall biosynthesis